MTDTATEAPAETTETPDNAQVVADAVAEKSGESEGVADYSFVLDKYKAEGRSDEESAIEQAKAYKELQSKFGAFTGAPEEYELILSEEMSEKVDLEEFKDDPILEEARVISKEMGINNEGFNKLTELYLKGQLADIKALESVKAEEMKALGPKAEARLNNVDAWSSHNLDAETHEKLKGVLTSAGAVEAVEALIAKTRNAPQVTETQQAEEISSAKLREMQTAKDEFGRPKMLDPEYRRKVEAAYSRKYGDEPQRTIRG